MEIISSIRESCKMRHFAYKNTYNEAMFDLWQKKIYVKYGYSGYDSGKNVLLVIDPLMNSLFLSTKTGTWELRPVVTFLYFFSCLDVFVTSGSMRYMSSKNKEKSSCITNQILGIFLFDSKGRRPKKCK